MIKNQELTAGETDMILFCILHLWVTFLPGPLITWNMRNSNYNIHYVRYCVHLFTFSKLQTQIRVIISVISTHSIILPVSSRVTVATSRLMMRNMLSGLLMKTALDLYNQPPHSCWLRKNRIWTHQVVAFCKTNRTTTGRV